MLGELSDIDSILLDAAFDPDSPLQWNESEPVPLFEKLDLDTIITTEQSLIDDRAHSKDNGQSEPPVDPEAGYIEFEDFLKVEMKTGKILSVDDHPDADKLYVITIEDGPESTRTVCAGLKGIYESSDLVGKNVVYVANLKPRKLRGVLSEGMLLAADDGDGGVSILTLDVEMPPGSVVR
jgi:methionyl-tRNA synthetase